MRIKGGFGWDHRSSDHRNLNGIYTDFIELRERKKSLEEIFNKIWPMARNNLSFSLHKYNLYSSFATDGID